jgi:photosystem II PsbH protein
MMKRKFLNSQTVEDCSNSWPKRTGAGSLFKPLISKYGGLFIFSFMGFAMALFLYSYLSFYILLFLSSVLIDVRCATLPSEVNHTRGSRTRLIIILYNALFSCNIESVLHSRTD